MQLYGVSGVKAFTVAKITSAERCHLVALTMKSEVQSWRKTFVLAAVKYEQKHYVEWIHLLKSLNIKNTLLQLHLILQALYLWRKLYVQDFIA